ncbi:PIN/TRAM domain-containing protein [Clostridiaceae bacterium HSG29]|nr:PIN/TRAM domain-containing protein [Clostridiaceae bacterium HSG29]
MLKRFSNVFIGGIGGLIGLGVANAIEKLELFPTVNRTVLYAASAIILFILFLLLSNAFIKVIKKLITMIEKEIFTLNSKEIIFSTIGFTLGMLIALLISNIFKYVPIRVIGLVLTVITYIIFGYLGISIPRNYVTNIDFLQYFPNVKKDKKSKNDDLENSKSFQCKIVDTSVIIDGRILHIAKTGFIEGKLIIPNFVLDELQHIADSADDLKRKKGRRGLDILKGLIDSKDIEVEVMDIDFEVEEVDSKLLKLAIKLNGAVLTNDYNLNKVAVVQDVKVLNINELANAVKPAVLPGEKFTVEIIQKGKGNNQGVGFLDDGTMIVVENGQKFIGKTINTLVTSVLQTDAGRMIFVKPE